MFRVLNLLFIAVSLVLSCSVSPEASHADPAVPQRLAIHAARMLDVRSGKYIADPLITIEGGRIVSVGTGSALPAGAKLIELGRLTLLPGLLDAHTHITYHFDENGIFGASGDASADITLKYAEENAKRTLEAGFTTIRNLGAGGRVDLRLRDLINKGGVEGPRIIASGLPLTPDMIYRMGKTERLETIKRFVQARIDEGADVIKIFEGVDQSGTPYISADDMRAAVDIAHAAGRKVAVHAHEAPAMIAAVKGGCDSIEHGTFGTDEAFDLMAKNKVTLVPTLYLPTHYLEHRKRFVFDDSTWDFFKKLQSSNLSNFKKARKHGVKVVSGSDAVAGLHGQNAREPMWLVKGGMTPAEALRAATADAADVLGLSGNVGELAAGDYADIIAVDGDPLANIGVLEQIAFVMKDGTVVKSTS